MKEIDLQIASIQEWIPNNVKTAAEKWQEHLYHQIQHQSKHYSTEFQSSLWPCIAEEHFYVHYYTSEVISS